MPLVPVRQSSPGRRKLDRKTRLIIRRVRLFLTGLTRKSVPSHGEPAVPLFASVPSEVKDHPGEVIVKVPILGFAATELYVIPDWDSLTIEGRVKQQRTFEGSNWTEVIERRLTHRLHFNFELDPNRITATFNDTVVEIVAHKMAD